MFCSPHIAFTLSASEDIEYTTQIEWTTFMVFLSFLKLQLGQKHLVCGTENRK